MLRGVGSARLDRADSFAEVEACGVCGSTRRSTRFEEAPFRVVRCGDCGLVYVTPRLRPEVLPEVYAGDYWRSDSPKQRGYADYVADARLYLRTFEKRWRLVRRFTGGPGRALDVGCAAGYWLRVLAERGWDVTGVEPSAEIAAHARHALGAARVHEGDLASARFEAGRFDLVTLWDVVEHVPDPVALLREAARVLSPGGVLVLETQNVESRFARLLGPRWQHFKHLEHLYHFGPGSLSALLARAGLEPLHRTARYGGKHVSVGFLRERATRLHPALERVLRPLARVDRWHAYVNVFDEMVVVARRPLA
jgi:SAM-dependent methyltransferase